MPAMTGTQQAGPFTVGTGAPTGTPKVTPAGYFDTATGTLWIWPSGGSAWVAATSSAAGLVGTYYQGAFAAASAQFFADATAIPSVITSGIATLTVTNTLTRPVAVMVWGDFSVSSVAGGTKSTTHDTTIELSYVRDNGGGTLNSGGLSSPSIYVVPKTIGSEGGVYSDMVTYNLTHEMMAFGASSTLAASSSRTYRLQASLRPGTIPTSTTSAANVSVTPRLRAFTIG